MRKNSHPKKLQVNQNQTFLQILTPPTSSEENDWEDICVSENESDNRAGIDTEQENSKIVISNKMLINQSPKLEIATLNMRLQFPGLFDILIPVSASPKQPIKYLTKLYNTLRGKYWIIHCYQYKCLICQTTFKYRPTLIAHLNRHLGFYVARCGKCSKKFFNVNCGRAHVEKCQIQL